MLNSQTIFTRKFERSAIGGYRNDDVDNFLNDVAQSFEELEEQNGVLSKKLEVLAEKLEEYRNDEESLRSALLGAQKLGDSVIRESKNKAEIILRDANIKAERILHSASDQMEKEKMVYIKLQKDVAAFKNKLMATYKQHIELISSLPDDPNKDKAPAKAEAVQVQEPVRAPQAPPKDDYNEGGVVQQERTPEPVQERIQEREQAMQRPPLRHEEAEDRIKPAPKKFIPVPHREAEGNTDNSADSRKSPYADEYYEDFTDEADKPEDETGAKKPSRFGTLKFGAGYDLKRE